MCPQLGWLRDRQCADEVLADERLRAGVSGAAAVEQRHTRVLAVARREHETGAKCLPDHRPEVGGCRGITHDRDLGWAVDREHREQVADRCRVFGEQAACSSEDAVDRRAQSVLSGERVETLQRFGCQRVVGRGRVVHVVLRVVDQRLGVSAGREEPGAARIGEQVHHVVGERPGRVDPSGSARRLEQSDQTVDQRPVVVAEAEDLARPEPRAAQQTALRCRMRFEAIGGGPLCGVEIPRRAEHCTRFGQCPDRQPIPCGDDLVVAPGCDAAAAPLEQGGVRPVLDGGQLVVCHVVAERERGRVHRQVEDVRSLEVAVVADAVQRSHEVGVVADDVPKLVEGPDIEFAFDPLGVGVLCGVETAPVVGHVPQ